MRGSSRYACSECGQTFISRDSRALHTRLRHFSVLPSPLSPAHAAAHVPQPAAATSEGYEESDASRRVGGMGLPAIRPHRSPSRFAVPPIPPFFGEAQAAGMAPASSDEVPWPEHSLRGDTSIALRLERARNVLDRRANSVDHSQLAEAVAEAAAEARLAAQARAYSEARVESLQVLEDEVDARIASLRERIDGALLLEDGERAARPIDEAAEPSRLTVNSDAAGEQAEYTQPGTRTRGSSPAPRSQPAPR